MSNEGWRTLRMALFCVTVIAVINLNANKIDWDELWQILQIAGGGAAIFGPTLLKGLFSGKGNSNNSDGSNTPDDGVSDGS
jgi:hypothetical protein